jgi:hypothetical protein
MNQLRFSIIVAIASLVASLSAKAQSDTVPYRMLLKNLAGQISVPDEARTRTYFIDLGKVVDQLAPPQYFGGRSSKRFKAISFDKTTQALVIQEVATQRNFTLVLGQETTISVKLE